MPEDEEVCAIKCFCFTGGIVMGFFGKLFEKKECSICGGEIGLLGNRKLEDGNMCKNCAAKLSPWFEDRRSSTIAQVNEQLAYREDNKTKVAVFNVTRTLGKNPKVLLDEDAGVFIVTMENDWQAENPDVLSFTDVTGCELDIEESKWEMTYTDKEGKSAHYNPPRYRYSYHFYVDVHVRHPYFDNMRFKLNGFSVDIETTGGMRGKAGAGVMNRMASGIVAFNPETDPEYRKYLTMGEEIKEALMTGRQQARNEMAAAAAPKMSVTCSYCGATTTPDASGCCEYCGGALNG